MSGYDSKSHVFSLCFCHAFESFSKHEAPTYAGRDSCVLLVSKQREVICLKLGLINLVPKMVTPKSFHKWTTISLTGGL